MGNEQSHEAAGGSQYESEEEEKFDLSAIEDTRLARRSSPPASSSPPPPAISPSRGHRGRRRSPSPVQERERSALQDSQASQPIANEPQDEHRRPSSSQSKPAMPSRRRKAKPRANSSKKRKVARAAHSSDEFEEGEEQYESVHEDEPEEESTADAEIRLAEEILLKSQAQRVREREPEMFDEYAFSEASEIEERLPETASELVDAPLETGTDVPEESLPKQDVFVDSGLGRPREACDEEERGDDNDNDHDEDDAIESADTGPARSNRHEIVRAVGEEPVDAPSTRETETAVGDIVTGNVPTGSNAFRGMTPEESSEHTASSKSIFDRTGDDEMVPDTPVPRPSKRKRALSTTPRKVYSTKKRRRETPPTSPDLHLDDRDDDEKVDLAPRETRSKAAQPAKRQSSMELFAQPFTKESGLRHPVYHPETPDKPRPRMTVEVVIPARYPEPDPPLHVSTPKSGLKKRSKSSLQRDNSEQRGNIWNIDEQPDAAGPSRQGLAKSVAKRSLGQDGHDSSSSSESESSDNDDKPAAGHSMPESRERKDKQRAVSGEPEAPRSDDPQSASTSKGKAPAKRRSNGVSNKRRSTGDGEHRCPICAQPYKTEASLKRHLEDPIAHKDMHECSHCDERFLSKAALSRHKKELGHGTPAQYTSGRFNLKEREALGRWRDHFCQDHSINHYEFNEMMTASSRQAASSWPYKFIGKLDFLQEYYDVLPDRDPRAMRRYRVNFQNVDYSRDWSTQDDEDIVRLVRELGPKWNEIGDTLTRDPEAVRQRYKNKLILGDAQNKGDWQDDEGKRFDDAVETIKRAAASTSGKGMDENTFNWSAVSKLVGTRTAQQCANHWRALHGKMKRSTWVDSGTDQLITPKSESKMEQRLSGKRLSAARIENSDEDVEDDDGGETDQEDESDNEEDAANNEDEEAEEADPGDEETQEPQSGKPVLSPAKTPVKRMTASQAFEETQAHTSGMKSSARRGKNAAPSQDAPSPGIAMQHRPQQNPDFERKLQAILDEVRPPSDNERSKSPEEDAITASEAEPGTSQTAARQQDGARGTSQSTEQSEDEAPKQNNHRLKRTLDEHARKAKAREVRPAKKRKIAFLDSDSESENEDGGGLPR